MFGKKQSQIKSCSQEDEKLPGPEEQQCQSCDIARKACAKFCPECRNKVIHTATCDSGIAEKPCQEKEVPPETGKNTTSTQADSPRDKTGTSNSKCRCGEEVAADAKFCPECGKSVTKVPFEYEVFCMCKDGTELTAKVNADEFIIGKASDCDLTIPNDGYVSRKHARILFSNGKLMLKDSSSNGTFVRINEPVELCPGDEIVIGANLLRVDEINSEAI